MTDVRRAAPDGEGFGSMLSGGHPNSLGRTRDVVALVLEDRGRLEELFACYDSPDPTVRLRTSSALVRIEAARHAWLVPFVDRLIDDVGALEQASARWTLAKLLLRLTPELTPAQRARAQELLTRTLTEATDWIVLIDTMETLTAWSSGDDVLRAWLGPHLFRLSQDRRRSVAARARRLAGTVQPAAGVATGPTAPRPWPRSGPS